MPKLGLHKCMCVNLHGRSWHLSGADPGLWAREGGWGEWGVQASPNVKWFTVGTDGVPHVYRGKMIAMKD